MRKERQMHQRSIRTLITLAAVWFAGVTYEAAPAEGLRADFNHGTLEGATEPQFFNRSKGPTTTDPGRASWRIEDGVVTIAGEFDSGSTGGHGDFVPLAWQELDVSLVDYPVLDVRFRVPDKSARILVQCTFEYADGTRRTPYFYAPFERPGEWEKLTTRLAGDSSSPTKWTPRRLVYLSIWLLGDRPLTADFDWVYLRGLNEEEQKKEDDWVALMDGYEPIEPQILKDFFPFGVYDAPPDSSSTHKISHRMAFRMLSKHHLNFVMAAHDNVKAAEEMGMCLGVRMRAGDFHFKRGGKQAVMDWAGPVVDSIKDSPALICYDMGDERKTFELWGTVAGIAALHQLDPLHPSAQTFYNLETIRDFDPYVSLNISDIYPISKGGDRTAAYLYDWCRRIARETDNKRHWMVLQSYGAAPWRKGQNDLFPTVEQLRLQIYAALAGGARGIIMYSTSYDRYRMLTDQWGNPSKLMKEAARLGEILIPLGRRLLDCEVELDTKILCDNEKILVGVVRSSERNARYVILANKDENLPQSGKLAGMNDALFDLEALEEVADGMVGPLLPGGGRIYMTGASAGFEAEAMIIRRNRVEEAERAATADRLFDTRGCNPEHRGKLDEAARIMGAIEPAMYFDNPDAKVVEMMTTQRDRYWGAHATWVLAYEALLTGDVLTDRRVDGILWHARGIVREVRHTLGNHPMYPREKVD